MVTSKLKALIKKAYKGRETMDAACSDIFKMIEDLLDLEYTDGMHVFIQQGDGLVLSWDIQNIPVSEIFVMYGLLGRKLKDDDLKSICI